MLVASALSSVSELLRQKYGDLGAAAFDRLGLWLSASVPFTHPEILEKHLDESRIELLFDSFRQILPFGTGGRRGRVGYGPNRVNPSTIATTVQGHCEYLKGAFAQRKRLAVVVANDVRVFNDFAGAYAFLGENHPLLGISSRSLGRLACEVYAANGITAYFEEPHAPHALLSTPELSYLIGKLQAVGGVNISASHNPPDDNGIKVYDHLGSQPVAPDDQRLVEAMDSVSSVHRIPFEQALAEGLVQAVPKELHREYVRGYIRLFEGIHKPDPSSPLVYTPLSGCGLTTVGDVLKGLGFPFLVPPGQGPDGTFSAIPLGVPNPEVSQATGPATLFADEQGSGIVLSSDPDADRIGLEVKLDDGTWHHFDGNQIATILCYYLMLDPHGPKRKGLVIETLVTTKILRKIVEKAGESFLIDDLLVGFKYVADVLKKLETEGHYKGVRCRPDQLVLATEESHGVILIPSIRDKDATPACMYFAALYQRLKAEGRSLFDYYVQILDDLGPYADASRSIMMNGIDGTIKRDKIMESLRNLPLESVAGSPVRKIVDHWDEGDEGWGKFKSETDKLPRNVLQYFFDSFIIAVRPSGTEPKLKLYCQLMPDNELSHTCGKQRLAAATAKAEKLALLVYKELLSRIDVDLDEAASLLPDMVDLELKQKFQRRTVPRLLESLSTGKCSNLADCLHWLRDQDEVAAMTPKKDPLPALKGPLAYLTKRWLQEKPLLSLIEELHRWAVGRD